MTRVGLRRYSLHRTYSSDRLSKWLQRPCVENPPLSFTSLFVDRCLLISRSQVHGTVGPIFTIVDGRKRTKLGVPTFRWRTVRTDEVWTFVFFPKYLISTSGSVLKSQGRSLTTMLNLYTFPFPFKENWPSLIVNVNHKISTTVL